jgi:phage gpG-like protein
MALRVTILSNADSFIKNINNIVRKLTDTTKLKEKIGNKLVEKAENIFSLQQSPWGQPWKPSERVLKLRRKPGYEEKGLTLVSTTNLRQSFGIINEGEAVYFSQNLKPGAKISKRTGKILNPNPVNYFGYHQFGTNRMVARPMVPVRGPWDSPKLDLPATYQTEIQKLVEDYINAALSS